MFEHSCQASCIQVAYQNQNQQVAGPCKLPSEPQAGSFVWEKRLLIFKSTLKGPVSLFSAAILMLLGL